MQIMFAFFVSIWNVDEQEIVESIISRLAG